MTRDSENAPTAHTLFDLRTDRRQTADPVCAPASDAGSLSKLFKSVPREKSSSFGRCHRWYDIGMTRAKIAISLPKHQLARVHREVRAGRADSVSGYIASALAEQEKRDSLRTLLRDLIEQHGEPAPEDVKWAERMLPRRGRG
jgi:Arc/MetJ-type ribon-helix-helix transcriptional regulator